MSIKLRLALGNHVRNIRTHSTRLGWVGIVARDLGDRWMVVYPNGIQETYLKGMAHNSLEKIKEECPCTQQALNLDLSKLEESALANPATWAAMYGASTSHFMVAEPKRRTLKKIRRNVISGKTQGEMIREMGNARGVQQFNTRCLGRSTGQALRLIGQAMCEPNVPVRLWDVDHHYVSNPNAQGLRHQINKGFVKLVESLLTKNHLVGFNFDHAKCYMTFNPIVTEETYVETH